MRNYKKKKKNKKNVIQLKITRGRRKREKKDNFITREETIFVFLNVKTLDKISTFHSLLALSFLLINH